MDFVGHILGSEGCNVDGTIGSNPLTAFVNQAFETSFGGFGDFPAEEVMFVEHEAVEQKQVRAYKRTSCPVGKAPDQLLSV
jgi:hypothetical protein